MANNELQMRKCEICGEWTELSAIEYCNECDDALCDSCIMSSGRCFQCDEVWLADHKEAY